MSEFSISEREAGVSAARRAAALRGVWDVTPMAMRELFLDGNVVHTR